MTKKQLLFYLIGKDNLRLGWLVRWMVFYRMFRVYLTRWKHFAKFGTYDPVPGAGVRILLPTPARHGTLGADPPGRDDEPSQLPDA